MLADLLAVAPILILLIALLGLKMPARKAGIVSFLAALVIALVVFRLPLFGMGIALGKGLSLSLYVLLIIWAAIFLYNLVNEAGAIKVIGENIILIIRDPFVQFLLLSWVFSSFLQGIAGFGVPVAIVTPILVQLGFNPLASVAAVLIGHSWSISFGSMGSSFYTIGLVTGMAGADLAFWMAVYTALAMVITGLSVTYLYGGIQALKQGTFLVLPTSAVMVIVMFAVTGFQMMSVVSLLTALIGMLFMFIFYRLVYQEGKASQLFQERLSLVESVFPYGLIIFLSVAFQLLPLNTPEIAFSFPGVETGLGYVVGAESNYVTINLLTHPAPIILLSALAGIVLYIHQNVLDREALGRVVQITVKKCIGTTVTLTFLICMALLMMDSGMIEKLAYNVAGATGGLYPLFAPFIGVLGSFITGSNTNSNVIFGSFQATVAASLGVSPAIMAAVQSIGGSVGCSLGPTQVLLGTSSVKLTGKEGYVYHRIIHLTLFAALALGMLNLLLLG